MSSLVRIIAASSVTLLLAACPSKPERPRADAEGVKTEAPRAAAVDAPTPASAADEAKAESSSCIYAQGQKDEGGHACPHGPEGGAAGDASGEGHFGAAFTLADARPLSSILEAQRHDAPVLVQGEVEAVCQKKGCWMVIKDGTDQARVLMKDHGFSVPMDCRGKTAVIEGTLAARTFSQAQVKHLAKDGGEDPEAVSGTRTEHVLTASGVRIQS